MEILVDLKLYTKYNISNVAGEEYRRYWIDKDSLKDYFVSFQYQT